MEQVKVWAHRGASGYAPENTLEAFELAIHQGADGIELDVHLSKDGELVVAHDEKVDRVSDGTGYIKDQTVAQLKKWNFNKTHPEYQSAKLPTLREVYELIRPTRLTINVEIKTGIVEYPGIERRLVELTQSMDMKNRVIYSSFHHKSLMEIRKWNPRAQIGLLYADGWLDVPAYAKKLGANAVHPQFLMVFEPEFMESCNEKQVLVNPWTVNHEKDMEALIKLGVNALITNYPDKALKTIEKTK